jgi:hypothetical protein
VTLILHLLFFESTGRTTLEINEELGEVDMKTTQHQRYIEKVEIRNGAMKTVIE